MGRGFSRAALLADGTQEYGYDRTSDHRNAADGMA